MKSTIYSIIGLIFFAIGVIGGVYFGLWVCFVGGIVDIIHGFQSEPWAATQIAFGVLKFFVSSLVGWGTFLIGMFIGNVFIQAA